MYKEVIEDINPKTPRTENVGVPFGMKLQLALVVAKESFRSRGRWALCIIPDPANGRIIIQREKNIEPKSE